MSFWSQRGLSLSARIVGFVAVFFCALSGFFAQPAYASVTPQFSYQAKLLSDTGTPVPDGIYAVKVSLYDAASAGTRLWTAKGTTVTPTGLGVSVTNGLFTINLGDTSVGGGSQNTLAGIDWNTQSLYLGVTIAGDSEMTPRRRLDAVPQAFFADNSNQLQGMYASSTAFDSNALFTINQTSNTSATGSRAALEVRSSGTNSALDYLFRGINDLGSTVFTLNRQGAVTSTGRLYVNDSTATSTILGNLTVGTSTRQTTMPPEFVMDGDDLLVGGAIGSASSVYTNAGVIIGASGPRITSGQMVVSGGFTVTSSAPVFLFGNGGSSSIQLGSSLRLKGGLTLSLEGGTTGAIVPSLGDRTATLGAAFLGRFDAYLGYVTTTQEVIRSSSTVTSTLQVTNTASASGGTAWGGYINRLLVGENVSATGTNDYVGVVSYNSANSHFGLCLNNETNASTCPTFTSTSTIYSLLADDAIGADAYDLAERYQLTGSAAPGDVLVIDPASPLHMKKSPGVAYDSSISGVVSTRPGFVLGAMDGAMVALVGRVPVKVTVANGVIHVGDLLTSSAQPGVAMKATQPGRILGRALENANADGTVEIFLQPGYDATALLQPDGSVTRIAGNIAVDARSAASESFPAVDSYDLSLRNAAWDGARSVTHAFSLANHLSAGKSSFDLRFDDSSSSLLSIDQLGNATISGDLAVSGKLFPSARGVAQTDKYLFLDNSTPGASYIATNASGWQADDAYDYAERYYSPDQLEPGDLVTVNQLGRVYVQRSLDDKQMLVGIVSTKPGFITGQPQPSTYPIALAGRVPTKVSTMNGAIEAGDQLAPSSIPGVAVKATKAGPIVGLALESYAAGDVGKIEVFVNPGWWGGKTGVVQPTTVAATTEKSETRQARGFAEIQSGEKRVKVSFPSVLAYPHVQVTPYAQTEGGWWVEHVTEAQFEIVLGQDAARDTRFSWQAEGADPEVKLFHSNGSVLKIDLITGAILDESSIIRLPLPSEPAPAVTSTVNEAPTVTSTTEIVPETASSTVEVTPTPPPTAETTTTTTETTTPTPLENETPTPSVAPVQEVTSTEGGT